MRLHLLMRLDPGQRRTHGQGLDQSSGPAGGVGDTWWRRGWGGRPRSLRDWKRVSHHYCHRVTRSGHSAFTHQSALAQSVCWVTLCLFPHPSISAFFILHQRTQAHCLPPLIHSHLFYLPPPSRGICPALFITALHHRPFLSVQSYWFQRPRRCDVLFSRFSPVPILPLGQGHFPVAPAESGEKLCLMND